MVARFGGYASDYMASHDWGDLFLDYQAAKILNKIDEEKEVAKNKAMFGTK